MNKIGVLIGILLLLLSFPNKNFGADKISSQSWSPSWHESNKKSFDSGEKILIEIDGDGKEDTIETRLFDVPIRNKSTNKHQVQNWIEFNVKLTSGKKMNPLKYQYGTDGICYWVYTLRSAGDINGDGMADLILYAGDDTSDETLTFISQGNEYILHAKESSDIPWGNSSLDAKEKENIEQILNSYLNCRKNLDFNCCANFLSKSYLAKFSKQNGSSYVKYNKLTETIYHEAKITQVNIVADSTVEAIVESYAEEPGILSKDIENYKMSKINGSWRIEDYFRISSTIVKEIGPDGKWKDVKN